MYASYLLTCYSINLLSFFFIAHSILTKAAPCENPNMPSKGPRSKNTFLITAILSSNPTHNSLGTMALNT